MQNIRDSAANTRASARAGLDKTKATVQEKEDRMSTKDPLQKERATENKEMRKAQADADKQYARDQNAASRMAAQAGAHPQYTTGAQQPTDQFQGGGGYMDSSGGFPGHSTGFSTRQESGDPDDVTGEDVPATRFNYC